MSVAVAAQFGMIATGLLAACVGNRAPLTSRTVVRTTQALSTDTELVDLFEQPRRNSSARLLALRSRRS